MEISKAFLASTSVLNQLGMSELNSKTGLFNIDFCVDRIQFMGRFNTNLSVKIASEFPNAVTEVCSQTGFISFKFEVNELSIRIVLT